jgi:hypothetical protein
MYVNAVIVGLRPQAGGEPDRAHWTSGGGTK